MKNNNKAGKVDKTTNNAGTKKHKKCGFLVFAVVLGIGILPIAGFVRRTQQNPALALGIVRNETSTLVQAIGDHRLACHGHSYKHVNDIRLVASRRDGALTWFRIEKWDGDSSWWKKVCGKVIATVRECFWPDDNGAYVITSKGYAANESLDCGRYVHVANVQVTCDDIYGAKVREYPVYVDERLSGTARMASFLDNAKVVAMLQREMRRTSPAGESYGTLLEQSGGWLCGVGPLARFKVDVL